MDSQGPIAPLRADLGATSQELGSTNGALDELEHDLSVELPQDLREFLLWSDGWEGSYGETYVHLHSVIDIVLANEWIASTFPGLVAIGTDGGGDIYALDYRLHLDGPSVVAMDPIAGFDSVMTIGTSFTDAMERLAAYGGPFEAEIVSPLDPN